MKKKVDECENCNYRSLCVRSDYYYAITFNCEKVKRLKKKKWWRKRRIK